MPSPGPAPPTVLTWAGRSRGCRVWVWAWRGYPSGLRHGLSIGGLTCPVSLPRAQWLCHSGPCSRRVFEAPFPAAWGPWVGGRASGRPRAVGRWGGPSQPTVPQAAGPAHPFPSLVLNLEPSVLAQPVFSQRQNPGLMKSTCLSLPTWAAQVAVSTSPPVLWAPPSAPSSAVRPPGHVPPRAAGGSCLALAGGVLGAGSVSRFSSGSLSCCRT